MSYVQIVLLILAIFNILSKYIPRQNKTKEGLLFYDVSEN